MKKLYLLLICAVLTAIGSQSLMAQGLIFSRTPDNTSLELFFDHRPVFKNTTKIDFDLQILDPQIFGQVMVVEFGEEAFSLSYISKKREDLRFVLNSLNDKSRLIDIPYDKEQLIPARWQHVNLSLIPEEEAVEVTMSGRTYHLVIPGMPLKGKASITFGSSMISISDAPSMAIKNIRISNSHHLFEYQLGEYSGNIAHELHGRRKGHIRNGHWQKSNQHNWLQLDSFDADCGAGICFRDSTSDIIIVNRDDLITYCPSTGRADTVSLSTPLSCIGYSGEAMYDPLTDAVHYYNLMRKGHFTEPFMATMGMDGHMHDVLGFKYSDPLHHHAYSFFPEMNRLFIFGGYGNYTYSDALTSYDFDRGVWEQVDYTGDHIPARMHTVSGVTSDGKMLIFGGVGNVIGRQELGKEFFYDLYSFDPLSHSVTKLWDIKGVQESEYYVPTRGIVVDDHNNALYILCRTRDSDVYLRRFNARTGESEVVSNLLSGVSNSILSSFYLFHDENYSKMYAVFRNSNEEDRTATIEVWSLDTPPVVGEATPKDRSKIMKWGAAGLILCLLIAAALFVIRRKQRKLALMDSGEEEGAMQVEPNSIYFYGGFTVIDRDGNDITQRFGVKIKQLLTIIMLHTELNDSISTAKLSTSIWPEKAPADAKNIRGVTMNHLRSLLEGLDGLDMVSEGGKWKIAMDERLHWDFYEAKMAAHKIVFTPDGGYDVETYEKFLGVLKRGPLLPRFVQFDWFDSIKIDCEEFVSRAAAILVKDLYEQQNYKDALRCADLILSIDRYDQTAIGYKLRCLRKMGKPEFARDVEARFKAQFETQDE